MSDYRFLEPLDVLYLRGNRLFGDAGAHGEALMPPWPSLAAGALRSKMLVTHGIDAADFAKADQTADLSDKLFACLGSPAQPGTFRINLFTLAQRQHGTDKVSPCFPLPADMMVCEDDLSDAAYLRPTQLHPAITCGYPLPRPPVLKAATQNKPQTRLWLNSAGLAAYLKGEVPNASQLLRQADLWQPDHRLGIALDGERRSAATGMIYTAETVAFCQDTGFLAAIEGAAGLIPQNGLLRLGGDGRGTHFSECAPVLPEPDWERIDRERRFRIVLATPGLFPDGWRLPGLDRQETGWRWQGPSCNARLVAAAVNRSEVISGWDLAKRHPKPAQKTVSVGSVYWFEELEGDFDNLRSLACEGLWPLLPNQENDSAWQSRRAEGFNNIWIAAWPRDN